MPIDAPPAHIGTRALSYSITQKGKRQGTLRRPVVQRSFHRVRQLSFQGLLLCIHPCHEEPQQAEKTGHGVQHTSDTISTSILLISIPPYTRAEETEAEAVATTCLQLHKRLI